MSASVLRGTRRSQRHTKTLKSGTGPTLGTGTTRVAGCIRRGSSNKSQSGEDQRVQRRRDGRGRVSRAELGSDVAQGKTQVATEGGSMERRGRE